MNFVALKMLVGDRLKYLGLVAGVAFAALLITQQASIFTGFARRTTAPMRDFIAGNDRDGTLLWVMDRQTRMTEDIKNLPDTALARVRSSDGVDWAVPMVKSYMQAKLPGGSVKTVRVIGLDDASLTGGPAVVEKGSLAELRRDRAVLINARDEKGHVGPKANRALNLAVGDRLDLNDNEVQVVGTYVSTAEFFWEPVIYTTYSRVLQIAPPQRKMTTYVLAKVREGFEVQAVADAIAARTGYKVLTTQQFAQLTQEFVLTETGILINFGITIVLGLVIGLLVAGQTFYGFVLDNLRHFGALKAMGTGNGTLLRMLLGQVVTVGGIGYGIGLAGACVTGYLFTKIGLAFEMLWPVPIVGGVAVLICCTIAGAFGMIRVLRLEPAVVFKA